MRQHAESFKDSIALAGGIPVFERSMLLPPTAFEGDSRFSPASSAITVVCTCTLYLLNECTVQLRTVLVP